MQLNIWRGMSPNYPSLRSLLRAAGLRATESRLVMLATLDRAPAPCSAAWLGNQLEGLCDRPTVYRNLNVLSTAGLVDEVGRACGQTWYQRSGRPRTGTLFVCTSCRDAHPIAARVESPDPLWRRAIERSWAFFTGVCPRCDSEVSPPCA